jgi:1-aminocyclopropane-1-carboxylate deaminase/D-cysteine desulfhydrase-like pyridoxal-dependent ACC family enzyme
MLAGPLEYYQQQASALVGAFCHQHGVPDGEGVAREVGVRLAWVDRALPRTFGNIRPGEIARCTQLSAAHGVVLDPIWTLAAWEAAEAAAGGGGGGRVLMVHSGGLLGLCGLAQRFPEEF